MFCTLRSNSPLSAPRNDTACASCRNRTKSHFIHFHPARWNCEEKVLGGRIGSGDLTHADKHGFFVIEPEAQPHLFEALRFMDANEYQTGIPAARNRVGRGADQILANRDAAGSEFGKNAKATFRRDGAW